MKLSTIHMVGTGGRIIARRNKTERERRELFSRYSLAGRISPSLSGEQRSFVAIATQVCREPIASAQGENIYWGRETSVRRRRPHVSQSQSLLPREREPLPPKIFLSLSLLYRGAHCCTALCQWGDKWAIVFCASERATTIVNALYIHTYSSSVFRLSRYNGSPLTPSRE